MTVLTEKRLMAIREALNFRLAGDLGDSTIDQKTYKDALEWVRVKIADKQRRREYSDEAKRLRPSPSVSRPHLSTPGEAE